VSAGSAPYIFDAQTAWQFFVGKMNGCIGEVSTVALLAGGAYLLWRRRISWHTPVCFMGTVVVFSAVLWSVDPSQNMSPVFHLLTGGLMIGAIFMATDMVTTPATAKGKVVFGIGCGVLTMVIRKWGSLPEGVSFAILLMNAVTPLINMATRPRAFGHRRTGLALE
jgi:electron transport complex protein RnfD